MGWFLVTIVVPVMAPIFGVLFLGAVRFPGPTEALDPMVTVKDGQLGWVATAACSAAIFEFIETIDIYASSNNGSLPKGWYLVMGPLVVSIIGSVLVAVFGAIYPTPLLDKPVNLRSWLSHYKVFVNSTVWILSSSLTFAYVHFELLPPVVTLRRLQ